MLSKLKLAIIGGGAIAAASLVLFIKDLYRQKKNAKYWREEYVRLDSEELAEIKLVIFEALMKISEFDPRYQTEGIMTELRRLKEEADLLTVPLAMSSKADMREVEALIDNLFLYLELVHDSNTAHVHGADAATQAAISAHLDVLKKLTLWEGKLNNESI